MPQTTKENLAQRLRSWRLAHGYTQSDAARELSLPFRTYQDWERDVAHPAAFVRSCLVKMLDAFEATLTETKSPQPK